MAATSNSHIGLLESTNAKGANPANPKVGQFEAHRYNPCSSGLVAQWIERLRPKEGVGGSNPSEAASL